MKKYLLIALAVLFVTATSSAVSTKGQSPRPLSQKKLELAARQGGKQVKKPLAKKSLQRQTDLQRLMSQRAALTASHGKAAAAKSARAPRRAAADIIYDQPAGEQTLYSRSGDAYFYFWGSVYWTSLADAVGNVVVNGDKVYIKNIVSQFGAGTWVEGTLSGSTITIQLPQTAYYYYSYGFGLEVSLLEYDEEEQWFVKSANQTLTLNYDAQTGSITSAGALATGDQMVGLTYDDDESWSGYADWDISYAKVTDEPVAAPAGLTTEQYALSADGYAGSLVQVGFSGNDVYVQGIDPNLPDNWVKGTVSGQTVTFKSGQYIGADEVAGYHQYLVSAKKEEVYDEDYDEYYDEYVLTDDDITFHYDAATKTLSESSLFLVNAGKTSVNYLSTFDNATLAPFVEVAATPAAPTGLDLYEGGFSYFLNGWGWGDLSFTMPSSDVDGNYILPEKLSYTVWTRVNGEERQLTFSSEDYQYLDEDELTEIPYGYTEGWDFSANGASHGVYYYVIGPEAFGVQAIYRGAGEERKSEIAWIDVEELGAEVQPDAATPAYPDVDPADVGSEIGYGFYTGDEELTTVTNNYKEETYDVAIKVDNADLVGSHIESITFPLQETEGVTDINVFLTSQLRVEGGKNAADLVAKAVTPAEPGFVTVKLDKPYTIPEGGVYVGYSLTVTDASSEFNQEPVAVTQQANEGGFYLHTSDGFLKWLDVAEGFGGSAVLQVTVTGKNIKENAAAPADVEAQYVKTGEAIQVPLTVVNHGSKGIQSLDVAYSVAGQTGTQHIDLAEAVSGFFGKTAESTLSVPAISERGDYDLTVTVTKVNGVANEDASGETTVALVALNTVPKHRTLLEEYTGFWCGWCPRGFVSLEKLAELYPDEYVLASYHNEDALEIMYSDYFPSNVEGFPTAFMDRQQEVDAYYGINYGVKDFGIADDLAVRNQVFGHADLAISSVLSDDEATVTVTTDVTFPYDVTDGDYRLEYILTEDGLTDPTWAQSNYYADGYDGYPEYMDAFTETSDSKVYGLTFNDVVVLMPQVGGVEGSIPATVQADVPVQHTFTFQLDEAVNTSYEPIIQNKSKLKVVVALLNATTGEVLNANKVKVGESTGISIVDANRNDQRSAVYYDLQGRRVAKTTKGLYIVNGRKVVVK